MRARILLASVLVTLAATPGTASAGSDFLVPLPGVVTFAPSHALLHNSALLRRAVLVVSFIRRF